MAEEKEEEGGGREIKGGKRERERGRGEGGKKWRRQEVEAKKGGWIKERGGEGGGGGGGGDSLEERGGDGQRRLDFISSCPFDVRDACCWPASAFLTNSSPRRPLISALCPLLSTFLSFSSSLRRELFPCAAQGAGGRGRATYVCKYAGMRARVCV